MFPCRSRCGDRDEPSPKRIKTEVREKSLQSDYSWRFSKVMLKTTGFGLHKRSWKRLVVALTHSVLVSTNTAANFQISHQQYLFFLPQTQLEIILRSP